MRSHKKIAKTIGLLLFSLAVMAGLEVAVADAVSDYPNKTITLISPWPPGHHVTLFCQILAEFAPEYFGQKLVVNAKPGGGGALGTATTVTSPPDGYTIGEGSIAQWGIIEMVRDVPYSHEGLKLVDSLAAYAGLLVVNANNPWKTLKEYLDAARKSPRPFKYGHVAKGGHLHLLHEDLNRQAGVKMIDVPMQGGDGVITGLLSGTIQSGVLSWVQIQAMVKAKKLRVLAALSNSRSEEAPDVPCMKELGYENHIGLVRWMFFVPKNTPDPIVDKIDKTFKKIYDDPEFKKKADKLGVTLHYEGREEITKATAIEREEIAKLLKDLSLLEKK
ncbi:MAG: tripartite tricarboxylate transporter substrate binding protein [Nitrospirae bacterium]|nr:tripartite tricarboxylate transporter substrate binding protein [Nitrospirota bacterium]